MKLFSLILVYLLSINAFGSYPVGFRGADDTGKQYPDTVVTPYKQTTKTSGSVALLETGNKNRLQNPGMEDTNTSNGWITSCTGTANPIPSAETTNPIEGKQSLVMTVSGGTSGGVCTIYQDATTKHALDGIVSMYVKSDTQAGVAFIKRVNGAEAIRFDPNASSTYRDIVSNPVLFKIPGAMGTTSTGVGVEVTVAASQTIAVTMDEAKVGLEDQKQVVGVDTDWISYTPTGAWATNTTYTGKWRRVGGNIEVQVFIKLSGAPNSATLSVSLPSGLEIDITKLLFGTQASNPLGQAQIRDFSVRAYPANVLHFNSTSVWMSAFADMAPYEQNAAVTQAIPITFGVDDEIILNFTAPIVGWSATTEVYNAAADFFSTDTNTLAFKATAITAITDSDPVGTFNTYSYAINSNTKTICGSAPTQTIADMKTNGILVYTRAYNAASTCGNPARVEIKIAAAGTSLPTLSKEIFKSAGKVTSGSLDYATLGLSGEYAIGALLNGYDPASGKLVIDIGMQTVTVTTGANIQYTDGTLQTSGYLVINAQPKKTTAVQDFGEFDYVYVRANSISGTQFISNSAQDIVIFENEIEDNANSYDPVTGTFTAPKECVYQFSVTLLYAPLTYNAGNRVYMSVLPSDSSKTTTIYSLYNLQAGTYTVGLNGATAIRLSKGETAQIAVGNNRTGGTSNFVTSANSNVLSIVCIPGQFR